MTEVNYKCPNCGGSIYTHDHYGSDRISGITVYGCGGRLIWHMHYFPSQVFVPETEIAELKEEIAELNAKYTSLLLQTTGFLDSLVDPVEEFVSLLAGEVDEIDFYDNFYEDDEDPEEINAQFLKGPTGVTAMGEKVRNYFFDNDLHEDEIDVLPGKDES